MNANNWTVEELVDVLQSYAPHYIVKCYADMDCISADEKESVRGYIRVGDVILVVEREA